MTGRAKALLEESEEQINRATKCGDPRFSAQLAVARILLAVAAEHLDPPDRGPGAPDYEYEDTRFARSAAEQFSNAAFTTTATAKETGVSPAFVRFSPDSLTASLEPFLLAVIRKAREVKP
jgi:hypothetical protein